MDERNPQKRKDLLNLAENAAVDALVRRLSMNRADSVWNGMLIIKSQIRFSSLEKKDEANQALDKLVQALIDEGENLSDPRLQADINTVRKAL